LADADHAEVNARVDDEVATGLPHALAADAIKFGAWDAATQGFDELRAVQFARRLSGGDQDAHGTSCRLFLQQVAGDYEALDLAGAFADSAELHVAIKLFRGIVLDEAVASMDL